MDLLKALHTGDWSRLDETGAPLEPLELSQLEVGIIIARIKKLAKDPSYKCPNALGLVHDAYKEQDWERQSEYGDFVRPAPSNKNAWKQYESFIQLSVKLLSKFRGVKGDWRTDRFSSVPTNDRSSMGSMAAAAVESFNIVWQQPLKSGIILEQVDGATLFRRNMLIENVCIDDIVCHLRQECTDHVIMEGIHTESEWIFHVYTLQGTHIETATIQSI
jgi:hypothetical protein